MTPTQSRRHSAGDAARPSPHAFARRALTALLPVSAGLFFGSCSGPHGGAGAGGMQFPPVPVEVALVEPRTVRDGIAALASLEAEDAIEVASEESGIVRELPFTEGRPVARGALLARLDDRELRADADRATALVAQADADARRMRKLFEQKTVSARDLETSETNLKVAQATEALAHTRLDKTEIRAAFAGVVGRRRVSPGAYVKSGDVITELASLDRLRVAFDVPERYASKLRVGTRVDITPAAFPGERFTGSVTVVDPIVNPDTRTLRLVARIPNPNRRLLPGMSANVTATLSERPKALVVPDEAVFAEGAQNFVYVVKPDNSVVRAAVSLGTRDSSRVEILQGLTAGDRVVRAGHQKLFDGARVSPVGAAAAGLGSGPSGGSSGPARTAPGSKR